MSENLKKIHLLTSKSFDRFEDLIAHYLEAGIEIFQMETGIVSHIVNDKDYIVKDVISPLDIIHAGNVFELEDTYCREVYKSKQVVGLPHVGVIEEMKGHPVYQNLSLEAYISAPIFVRDTLYGTLNFTSRIPRHHGFSEHERDLIALMANSIGNFILLQEKEQSLLHLNDRLKEFIGYVAHDLRNPLGIVSNLANLVTTIDMVDSEKVKLIKRIHTNADRCLELVNAILEIAALGTGKINIDPRPFLFVDCLNDAIDNYMALANKRNIAIAVNIPPRLKVTGDDQRLLQVLNNLIGNAVKYSGSNEKVEIAYQGDLDGRAYFIFTNYYDANGDDSLSTHHDIYKSVGFGLDIAKEILNLHGSELDISKNGGLFTAKISLPLSMN